MEIPLGSSQSKDKTPSPVNNSSFPILPPNDKQAQQKRLIPLRWKIAQYPQHALEWGKKLIFSSQLHIDIDIYIFFPYKICYYRLDLLGGQKKPGSEFLTNLH